MAVSLIRWQFCLCGSSRVEVNSFRPVGRLCFRSDVDFCRKRWSVQIGRGFLQEESCNRAFRSDVDFCSKRCLVCMSPHNNWKDEIHQAFSGGATILLVDPVVDVEDCSLVHPPLEQKDGPSPAGQANSDDRRSQRGRRCCSPNVPVGGGLDRGNRHGTVRIANSSPALK